jgi:hypothetical protein
MESICAMRCCRIIRSIRKEPSADMIPPSLPQDDQEILKRLFFVRELIHVDLTARDASLLSGDGGKRLRGKPTTTIYPASTATCAAFDALYEELAARKLLSNELDHFREDHLGLSEAINALNTLAAEMIGMNTTLLPTFVG